MSADTRIAVIHERLRGMDSALRMQATEYERRLHDLNNAHAEATRVLNTYLTREIFDQTIKEWSEWRNKVDIVIAADTSRKGVYTSLIATTIAIAAIVVSVVNVLN